MIFETFKTVFQIKDSVSIFDEVFTPGERDVIKKMPPLPSGESTQILLADVMYLCRLRVLRNLLTEGYTFDQLGILEQDQ